MAFEELVLQGRSLDNLAPNDFGLKVCRLSERKRQVLGLLTSGFNAKMIASELKLSEETIKTHIKQIKERLGCCSQYELIKKCYQMHIEARTQVSLNC